MLFLTVWVVSVIAATMIGSRKGTPLLAFLVGLLFGPIGVLFVALSRGNRKHCEFCKELMNKKATVCPHCRKDVTAEPRISG